MRRRDRTSLPIGWDYTPDRRPARARVVGVDPIGIGTADPEAMTSYIQRVAREEDLPAVHFARHVLASALGRGDVPGCSRDEWGRYFAAIFQMVRGSVDGVGRHASTWTAALEEVLGRDDLRQLTLLPFASVLPPQGLTRPIKHVCPACLDGWQASRQAGQTCLIGRVRPWGGRTDANGSSVSCRRSSRPRTSSRAAVHVEAWRPTPSTDPRTIWKIAAKYRPHSSREQPGTSPRPRADASTCRAKWTAGRSSSLATRWM